MFGKIKITALKVERHSQHVCHAGQLLAMIMKHVSVLCRCPSLHSPWQENSVAFSRHLHSYRISAWRVHKRGRTEEPFAAADLTLEWLRSFLVALSRWLFVTPACLGYCRIV